MKSLTVKRFRWIDPEVTAVRTEQGVMSLWTLFLPLFVEQLLMNLMGTVNTLVLGSYSDEAVAAVGAANQLIGLIYTFFAVISGGASIVISHRLGAGEAGEAGNASFAALVFEGFLSLCAGLGMAAASLPLMSMMRLEGEVLSMAAGYFRICIGFSFLQGIMASSSAVLRSYGRPRTAVGVSLLMNLINAALNYVVIFRPFETPFYGTDGIAAVNVISRLIAAAVMLACLFGGKLNLELHKKRLKDLRLLGSILKVGLPGGVSSLSYSLSQVVSTSILAVLGTAALSAKIYISTLVFYVYVTGMSLGLATSILMGWMTGAGEYEKAYRLNQQVLKLAVALNLGLSVTLFFLRRPLLGLFTDSPEILSMAGTVLFIDIFVEVGRAFNHVEDNSLRGAGDVMFPMVVAVVSCWLISILFSYVLGIRMGLGLKGCWIAFMMDELFRGLIFWRRFRSRKWVGKKV